MKEYIENSGKRVEKSILKLLKKDYGAKEMAGLYFKISTNKAEGNSWFQTERGELSYPFGNWSLCRFGFPKIASVAANESVKGRLIGRRLWTTD